MKSCTTFLFSFCYLYVFSQFELGSVSMTYTDDTRNRDLPFELLYPAQIAGVGVPCADGMFPYIVIAHGFSMQANDYSYLAEDLASNGYFVLQLATESGFVPSHEDYGLDILFLATHFREENITVGSLMAGHVMSKAGVIGHSMGGGSAWLAASQSDGGIDCLVGMAPAETNPSAIDAAPQVLMPAMILSGSSDAVTPPAQNHQPIFDQTSSSCKVFVNVMEGSHCGFADGGTLCQFGEFGFNGLDASSQQSIALDMVNAWMDWHLKDVSTAPSIIESYDGSQSNTQTQNNCVISNVAGYASSSFYMYPNPCSSKIYLVDSSGMMLWHVYNIDGRRIAMIGKRNQDGTIELDVSSLASGIYVVADSNNLTKGRLIIR